MTREIPTPLDQPEDRPSGGALANRRVFAVVNYKGGVGKTTLTLNLGAAFALLGQRVLLIDLDSSGNLTEGLGLTLDKDDPAQPTVYHLLKPQSPSSPRPRLASLVQPVEFSGASLGRDGQDTLQLALLPSNHALGGVKYTIRDDFDWGRTLARAIWRRDSADRGADLAYDLVLIDCPPEHRNVYTALALGAATDALVVIQPESGAISGAGEMIQGVEAMREHNPALGPARLVVNMLDSRTNLSREMLGALREAYDGSLLQTAIPRSVRVAESMLAREPVVLYDPAGAPARAFLSLAQELLAMDKSAHRSEVRDGR